MITWMQRHKKYLIITIWISTIAFVGAGFVGWGQYSYGDKAGAVAKVGNVELTMGDLQKSYSRLYSQYNQMFQGNFDEEKAKSFGLQSQALKQLTDQALLLNLANDYDLSVSDEELISELKTQEYFFKDGAFDKETYKQVLSKNNLSLKEYENDLKKQMLIQKTLQLLPVNADANEINILETVMNVADKINYKVLSDENIKVDTSDEKVKAFWETQKQNFMTEVAYELRYIKQTKINQEYSDDEISTHYNENKTHFKDSEGKVLSLEDAKNSVIFELDAKATKDAALRTYIAFKKDKLDENVVVESKTISASNNPFDVQTLEHISKLSVTSPFMKPVEIDGEYFSIELVNVIPSKTKSFEDAKAEVLPLYIATKKREKLFELANSSVESFDGIESELITVQNGDKIKELEIADANDFLVQLFSKQEKRSFIVLESGKIVLYNILEQKLLTNTNNIPGDAIVNLKSAMFNEGLINTLQNKYKTEIFIEGL